MKMGLILRLVVGIIASISTTTLAYPYNSQLKLGKINPIPQQEHSLEHVQKPDKAPEYNIVDIGKKGKHHLLPGREGKVVMPDMEFEQHMPNLDLDKFTELKPEDYHQGEHQEQEMKHDHHLDDIIAHDHDHHEQQHHENSHEEYHQADIHRQDLEKDEPEMYNHEMLDYVLWATIPPYFPNGKLEWFKHYPTVEWIGDPKQCTQQPPTPSPVRFQLLPYHFHLTSPVSNGHKIAPMKPVKEKQPKPHSPDTKNHMLTKIFVPAKTVVTSTTTTTTKSPTKSLGMKLEQQQDMKGAKNFQTMDHQQQQIELPIQQQPHHPTKDQQKVDPTKTQQKEQHTPQIEEKHPIKIQQKEEPHPTKTQQKGQSRIPANKGEQQRKDGHAKETHQYKEEEKHQDIQRHPIKGQPKEEDQSTKGQQREEHPTKTAQINDKPQVQVIVPEQKEEQHSANIQQVEEHNPSKIFDHSIKDQEKEDRKEDLPAKSDEHEVEQFDVQKLEKPVAQEEKTQLQKAIPSKGKKEHREDEPPKPTKQPVKVIETNKAIQEGQHQQLQILGQEPESLYSEGSGPQLMGNSDHPFGQRQQSGRMANPPVNQNVRESFLSAAEHARHLSRVLSSSNGLPGDSTAARSSRTSSTSVRNPTMRLSQSDSSDTTPMQRLYLGPGSLERHEANGRTQVRLSCNLGPETARISKIEWVKFVGDYEMDSNSEPSFECRVQSCRMEQVKSDPLLTVHSNIVPQSSSGHGLSQAALTIHQVEDEHQAVYRCSGIRETPAGKRELVYRLIAV